MTLDDYNTLEQDFLTSGTDIKTFLKQRAISYNTYYYWKRESKDLKEQSIDSHGQFLPIDMQYGNIKPSRRSKNLKQPLITQER